MPIVWACAPPGQRSRPPRTSVLLVFRHRQTAGRHTKSVSSSCCAGALSVGTTSTMGICAWQGCCEKGLPAQGTGT
eukprot:270761-Rhodomonas_salina.1